MCNRLDTIPACGGRTNGQTSCHGMVRAMHTRREVKKLTGSRFGLTHEINKIIKCKTNNKLMGVIGEVQSHYHEGSPADKRSLRWEGFIEKVGFESGVKE